MTTIEKDNAIQSINERLLQLSAIMAKSDAHASKCTKLGVAFRDVYPDEFAEYNSARDEYNSLELQLAELEQIEVEEMPSELGN